ncbi:hypothetical protein Nepgr_026561, partial [Nepenthes gracilis]
MDPCLKRRYDEPETTLSCWPIVERDDKNGIGSAPTEEDIFTQFHNSKEDKTFRMTVKDVYLSDAPLSLGR